MWSTVDRADTPRPRRTQFEDTYTTVCMDLLDGALSLVNSEAPVISIPVHSSLVPWPTHPPASILTLESCRTVIPTASEHGVCEIPSQGALVLTIYLRSQDRSHGGLHSGHSDGTAMQRHARG